MYAAYSRFTEAGIHRRNAAQLAVERAARREAQRLAREAREAHQAERARQVLAAEEAAQDERTAKRDLRRDLEEARKEAVSRLMEIEAEAKEQRAYIDKLEAAARAVAIFTYESIERRACKIFGVSLEEIRSPVRNRRLVNARHFISYWCFRLTPLSLPQIGRHMGGRDHTTIMNGRDVYRERRALMGRELRPAR